MKKHNFKNSRLNHILNHELSERPEEFKIYEGTVGGFSIEIEDLSVPYSINSVLYGDNKTNRDKDMELLLNILTDLKEKENV